MRIIVDGWDNHQIFCKNFEVIVILKPSNFLEKILKLLAMSILKLLAMSILKLCKTPLAVIKFFGKNNKVLAKHWQKLKGIGIGKDYFEVIV